MNKRTAIRLCLGALLVCVLPAGCLFLYGRTRIVARTVAPNGVELCVTQYGGVEGYYTSVYYRRPGSPWGWFYYDHQDLYWGTARVETDAARSLITVFRNGRPALTFDYDTETYTLLRWSRTITGAQEWKPPAWELSDL